MAFMASLPSFRAEVCIGACCGACLSRRQPLRPARADRRYRKLPARSYKQDRHGTTAVKDVENEQRTHLSTSRSLFTAGAAAVTLLAAGPGTAADKIGEFSASGFIFKDSVEAVAVEDPDVKGVTIYISDFHRSLSDKLNKDFFSEPSQASVTCALTGPIQIKDYKAISGAEGHEVFSERKGINLFQNKTLRVRRLYDDKNNTLLYVSYSTRLDGSKNTTGSRYRTSICALPIAPSVAPAAASPATELPAPMK